MSRLTTRYLGLELRTPLVASAGPYTRTPESALRLQEAGASAIVMPSLFEEEVAREQDELSRALDQGSESFAEALNYFPALAAVESTAERYLASVAEMKQRLDIPVIASLNGTSPGGWAYFAGEIEQAGADALELNLYRIAADPAQTGAAVEERDVEVVRRVRQATRLPLAVKISPAYSALANHAVRLIEAGADGLVLFNRFYQPDIDPDSREVIPKVSLSEPWELRLPLRWLAILRPLSAGRACLAASSGVASGVDVAKALLVGADVAMTTSALLRHGREHLATMERELMAWLDANEYFTVEELRGSVSYAASDNPAAFERANYLRVLRSWNPPNELTTRPQLP